jgi:hypothetical protein
MASIEYKDHEIRIEPHPLGDSPRTYCNVGVMVCWHNRHILGDEQPRETPKEWLHNFLEEHPRAIIRPLFLLDHSGLRISTMSFNDPWDSGQVGYIYTLDSSVEVSELELEVEMYDQYLCGDVYSFSVLRDEEIIDSLCDIYGYDYCLSLAKESVDENVPMDEDLNAYFE